MKIEFSQYSKEQKGILVIGFLCMFITMGALINCNGIFIKPISITLKCSHFKISIIYFLYIIGQIFLQIFLEKILKRIVIKKVMEYSCLLISLNLLIIILFKELMILYFCAFFIGIGVGGMTTVPISILIKNNFLKNYGVVLGIVLSGSGIGGMIFGPIFINLIPIVGWKKCYLLLLLIHLLILYPLIKKKISTYNLKEDNVERKARKSQSYLRERKFWLFGIASMITYSSISTVHQTLASYLNDLNYSISKISLIFSLGMFSLAIGKVVLGKIYDMFSVKKSTIFSALNAVIAIISIIFIKVNRIEYIYIVTLGLGYSFGSIAYPFVTEKLFKEKEFVKINSIYNAIGNLSLGLGMILASMIYDKFHNYGVIYRAFVVLSLVSILIYIKIIPEDKILKKEV